MQSTQFGRAMLTSFQHSNRPVVNRRCVHVLALFFFPAICTADLDNGDPPSDFQRRELYAFEQCASTCQIELDQGLFRCPEFSDDTENVEAESCRARSRERHQRVTYLLIGRLLSRKENDVLAKAQVYADSAEFQDAASAFRHGMRNPNQTMDEARLLANAFVRRQFQRAWEAPTHEDALFEFGVALHTIQDSTSPAHAGFQPWSGHETFGQQARHVGAELTDPGRGSALHLATQTAWQWFQQGQLPEGDLFIFGRD